MDFFQLKYFVEVARQEHMGRAAHVLSISQSALSHAIAALEEDLGTPLFIRERRRIFLTEAGRFLLIRGEQLLSEKRRLEEEMRSLSGALYGSIRMSAPIAINAHIVGPAWAGISREHPKVHAEISSLRSIEITPKVISGEFDFGICFGPQAHPLLETSSLGVRRLVVLAKRGTLADKSKSPPHNLSNFPCALPKGLLGFGHGDAHPFFERYRIKPNVCLLYDNYEVAIAFIRETRAWALLPDWIATAYQGEFQVYRLNAIFEPLEITAIWPKSRSKSALTKLVEDKVRSKSS